MHDPTLSGFNEADIDPQDLLRLHASFEFHGLDPGLTAVLHGLQQQQLDCSSLPRRIHKLDLSIRPRRSRLGKLLAALHLSKDYALPIPPFRLQIRRADSLAQSLPVYRRRLFTDEIPRSAAKSLFRQLHERFGDTSDELAVLALYRNIPPDCAGSISIDENLQQASFIPAGQTSGRRRVAQGHYLVVLRDASGKLRRVLFRLE